MYCHECARDGVERVAACDHHPERPFAPRPDTVGPEVGAVAGQVGSI